MADYSDPSVQYRVDPESGRSVPGQFIWTPLAGDQQSIEDELVYTPDATELIPPANPSPQAAEMTTAAVGILTAPTLDEIQALQDEENAEQAAAPSLRSVCDRYYNGCVGGQSEPNNCAHYLSNAFILAGYSELLSSGLITARCRCGRRRPIRAYDMLRWFQSKRRVFKNGRIERNTGIWATYQEKPGWKHVTLIDTDRWLHFGTGDYWDWPTQYNYKW